MTNLLDEFRSTSITWDKATRRIYSPISANGSDSNGRKLNIQVVNSGQVENLTGATLHLYWETKDKVQHGLDAFTASDISKGEFEIFYTTGMLSNVGELNAALVLVDGTGKVVSDWFKITVTRGINEGAIESENSFSSLTQALIDVNNLEQNYAPRLNEVTAQLQQTSNLILNRSRHPIVEYLLKTPRIMAHRALYKILPENTIPAFYTAWRMGVELFETDIRKTIDGHFVVIHDENTLRTTGVDKVVSQSTLSELRELNQSEVANASFYGNPKIPKIEELFQFIKDTKCIVNVNFDYGISPSDALVILDKIYSYGIENNVILQGKFFREADKEICVTEGLPLTDEAFSEASLRGNVLTAYNYGYSGDVSATNAAMKLASRYRIPVLLYTVETYPNFRALDKTGVNAMMVDYYWQREGAIK